MKEKTHREPKDIVSLEKLRATWSTAMSAIMKSSRSPVVLKAWTYPDSCTLYARGTPA